MRSAGRTSSCRCDATRLFESCATRGRARPFHEQTADKTARISMLLKVWHCANSFVAFSRMSTSGCFAELNVIALLVAYKARRPHAGTGKLVQKGRLSTLRLLRAVYRTYAIRRHCPFRVTVVSGANDTTLGRRAGMTSATAEAIRRHPTAALGHAPRRGRTACGRCVIPGDRSRPARSTSGRVPPGESSPFRAQASHATASERASCAAGLRPAIYWTRD
jgi:hypothetical protein